jgi:hypothetical protein
MTGLLTLLMRRLRLLTWKRCRRAFVLGILLIGLSMSSCSSLKNINARTDVSCEVFKVITWSDKDTKPTLEQVFAHNKTWDTICQ